MNREIKFRAWDVKKKKWYEPTYEAYRGILHDLNLTLHTGWYVRTMENGEESSYHESASDEKYEFCQFTGLKDNNGNEIYEGDVVEIRKDGKIFDEASRVIFSQYGGFQFYDMTFQDVFRDSNYDVRIIGNVFENPSLLK